MVEPYCPMEKMPLIPYVCNLERSGLGIWKDFEFKFSKGRIIVSLFLTPDYKLLNRSFTNQHFT